MDEPYKQAIGLKKLFITIIEVNKFDVVLNVEISYALVSTCVSCSLK